MKHIIVVCNLEDVEFERLSTSSSRYELEFLRNISYRADRVSVVSPKMAKDCNVGNIGFFKCTDCDLMFRIKPLVNMVKKLINRDDDTVVFFWGYNPILINLLCKLKSSHVKVVSMIYDTHLGSIQNKSKLKAFVIDLFYRIGMLQVNKLDAVVLFNEKACNHLKLKNKFCVVLPGVDIESVSPYVETDNDKTVFLYTGTLSEYNCIRELLDAFISVNSSDIRLKIFGDGPLTEIVRTAENECSCIEYGGRINNESLSKEIERADVLLNLRNTESIVNDFAFPSKVIEYMSYGKAVLSSKVSDASEFADSVFLIESRDKASICDTIDYIMKHKNDFSEKVDKTKEYLSKYHNNETIYSQLYDFLFGELFE